MDLKKELRHALSSSRNIFDIVGSVDASLREIACSLRELEEEGVKPEPRVSGIRWDFVRSRYYDICRKRPKPVVDYDQGYATCASVLKRVRLLDDRHDLEGSKILVLGDDDLTSVALALTGKPSEIAVLEIDERIVDFVNQAELGDGLPSPKAFRYDIRQDLPKDFVKHFDVCVTDPLETKSGFSMFLKRVCDSLKGKGSVLLTCITDVECPRPRQHLFQKYMNQSGFVITDIIANAQRYVLPDDSFILREFPGLTRFCSSKPKRRLWYRSSLVRAELVCDPITPWYNSRPESDIYLDCEEDQPAERLT